MQFNGRVLVAEDNIINQKLIKQILMKYGINVDLANNGLEAFDKVKSQKYDLILMDIQMPVMDGIEATQEILNYESEENLEHTPIVALTANALKGDKERFIQQGLDDYLSKPIESSELLFVLKKFLKQKFNEDDESFYDNIDFLPKESNQNSVSSNSSECSNDDEAVDLMFDALDDDIEKGILVFKKNPLEAQILAKVLMNIGHTVEIIATTQELEEKIVDSSYDILLIDIELIDYSILKKQHRGMNVVLLSLKEVDESNFDKSIIKEILIGVMQIDKLKQIISKYRGNH